MTFARPPLSREGDAGDGAPRRDFGRDRLQTGGELSAGIVECF
jgi:hypothetical protein